MADKDPKDLDFDELHEAVNALMTQAQKGKPAAKDDSATTGDDKPATPPKKRDDPADDDNKVQVSVKRPAAASAAIKQHRGSHGRAMDVVGPREKADIVPPSARPNRQGATLQPTQDVKPEPVVPVIVPERQPLPDTPGQESSNGLDEALATLDKHETANDNSTLTHQKSEFPDPLEMLDQSEDKAGDEVNKANGEQQAADASSNEAEEPAAPTIEAADEAEASTMDREEPSSPFVTTKVEKRPLGAYSDAQSLGETAVAESSDKDEAQAAAPEGEKDAPSPLPPQPQPEEFNPAVVAVESAEPEVPTADDDTQSEVSPGQASQSDVPAPEESEGTDLRSMQIPQQYKEAEVLATDAQRPVFDTNEYHPAIEARTGGSAHHGALGAWVMAILLLVLLVVVLGAVYYFITGTLDFTALL